MVTPNIVVTIGRQMGSGGHELGRRLAARLGIEFYDKELLMQAARDAGLCPDFFRNSDEKRPSFVGGFFANFPGASSMAYYDAGGFGGGYDALYNAQCDFVRRVASRGSCVIVGRSADYILRNHPRVASIFVSAAKDDCIGRVRRRRPEISIEQARTIVEKTDKARAAFYNFTVISSGARPHRMTWPLVPPPWTSTIWWKWWPTTCSVASASKSTKRQKNIQQCQSSQQYFSS